MDEYKRMTYEHYSEMSENSKYPFTLIASMETFIGDLDEAIHIWKFNGYGEYQQIQKQILDYPKHCSYLKDIKKMIRFRKTQICLEFAFWQDSIKPIEPGGIYELRSYRLKSGKLLEWQQSWKVGLKCRAQYCHPVGAWFSQLGDLNYVHHMWHYPDLAQRKLSREGAWKSEGWAETVYTTAPLVEVMQSRIMSPIIPSGFNKRI
jgi:hypothetical protein